MAGVGGLAFAGELRVPVGPCLGVHLVQAESPAPVPALGTFPALDLPDRVEDAGVGLGGGGATEQQDGDQGRESHGRRGTNEPCTVTSPMR